MLLRLRNENNKKISMRAKTKTQTKVSIIIHQVKRTGTILVILLNVFWSFFVVVVVSQFQFFFQPTTMHTYIFSLSQSYLRNR